MCFSLRTSLISYTIGLASAIFAFATRQVVLGMLIIAYIQMQISELMIWYGIDKNDLSWNKTGTTFGKYLLAIHNLAIGLGIILSIIFISKRQLKLTDFIPAIVGLVFFVVIVLAVYLPNKYSDTTWPYKRICSDKCQSPENRLKWPYRHDWYLFSYIISVIIMFVYIKPNASRFLMLVMFSISFIVAALIYPNTVGSVWCWSTAFLAPAIVLINYYFIKNEPDSALLV